MKYGMIATWRMAYEGIIDTIPKLKDGLSCGEALVESIKKTEDYPFFKSVGFGGLPNEEGIVELDAAFMNGDNFDIGAIAGSRNVKNPIEVAENLSHERFNIFLVGEGITKYATKNNFEIKNMLSDRAKRMWEIRLEDIKNKGLTPYDGHDTIGMVVLDTKGSMAVGTSSSGLFMKKEGRIGDSPLSGSGFYCDSEIGGAAATGLGEDLMKGCLSYEIVRLMKEGLHPQEAANKALYDFDEKLKKLRGKSGAMSLVCMNNQGEWGIATNVEFSFVVGTDTEEVEIYVANPGPNKTTLVEVASQEWLDAYEKRIKKPLD
ncbi:N(4)-(beta-N-acetylglucosaminyl)-L-asparaginase [Miniphocaeibacter halophilus]|uniref:N(4)-(Beta-N-acetylglucosaminyl)-L-asparaginase n=1 Tax=Miniphocaeibacter halophilus TaxID=2931922 RepID=A0AC61MTL5_9FIRM|nr:N(4)-(beta-N-acetylglucosaminyl)-L-asparaginase [Miniphocaeibacter halophilus]QQK08882.1 N(4)-(beta-N-acetylglucosaminyl)-L-asparaginase [Miniphocaeibacter halophilus]